MKLRFGDIILTKYKLVRYYTSPPLDKENPKPHTDSDVLHHWVPGERDTPVEGIFLGYRVLKNGHYEPPAYDPEGDSSPYFAPTEYLKGALICIKGHKPEYVLIEHLEKV